MNKAPTKETMEGWIQLHRSHRYLLERVESALKSEGLPPLDWYDVLLELKRVKKTGLRQYEISGKVLLNKHNLSRLIDRLEKNGLVQRNACPEDGRGNLIKITSAGEKVLKQAWPVYSHVIEESFGTILKSDEIVELTRVLSLVLGRAERLT